MTRAQSLWFKTWTLVFDVRYNCEILWLERFTVHHKYLFTSLTLSLLSLVVLSFNTLVMPSLRSIGAPALLIVLCYLLEC